MNYSNNNNEQTNKKEQSVSFSVTLTEANKIFKALGSLPFNEVYELIGKLNDQANEQLTNNNLKISQSEISTEELIKKQIR
jgi:hypothetical protein